MSNIRKPKEPALFEGRETINELTAELHAGNVQKGFWDNERNFGECVALVHSELSEALEGDRAKRILRPGDIEQVEVLEGEAFLEAFVEKIKGTREVELVDAAYRIFDLAAGIGFDFERLIRLKMKYNAKRPPKHGKEY